MYHHHEYSNDNDVKYLVIRTIYEYQENGSDIWSTYTNMFIFIVVESENWDLHISEMNRGVDGTLMSEVTSVTINHIQLTAVASHIID